MNIVPYFRINIEHDFLITTNISHNPTENAQIEKYENHPSVTAIKKHMSSTNSSFAFQTVTKENIGKLITNSDIKKAVQSMDIPTKSVKEFGCLFSSFIASNVNKCINEGTYMDALKKAEIRLFYKKDGRTEKSNYRPIHVLSNVLKHYDQIYSYFDKIFSRYQCGFCKGISTQHTLLTMIEKMRILHDNKQFCAAILTHL